MATDEKTFRAQEDPQRAYFLLGFLNAARDFPRTSALSAAFSKELHAMNFVKWSVTKRTTPSG